MPSGTARRGVPAWVWIVVSVVGAVVMLAVGLVVAGVVGFGVVASSGGGSDVKRDKAFTAADPAGSSACDWLDMHLNGIGSWQDADSAAAKATTEDVRAATTPHEMYDACVAAGANMSPWREPTSP